MKETNFDLICATCENEFDERFTPDEKGIVNEWTACPACRDEIHFGYDVNKDEELYFEDLEKMGYKF